MKGWQLRNARSYALKTMDMCMRECNMLINASVVTGDPPYHLHPSPTVLSHALETVLRSAGAHGGWTSIGIYVKVSQIYHFKSQQIVLWLNGLVSLQIAILAGLYTGLPPPATNISRLVVYAGPRPEHIVRWVAVTWPPSLTRPPMTSWPGYPPRRGPGLVGGRCWERGRGVMELRGSLKAGPLVSLTTRRAHKIMQSSIGLPIQASGTMLMIKLMI